MKIKFFRDDAFLPNKAHPTDCGVDIYCPDGFEIKPFETICLGLGIGFEVPDGYAGIFCPRSSVSKMGLIIQTSITDPGYTGEVHLIVTNCSLNTYTFNRGDRLCSFNLFATKNEDLNIVSEFKKTDRGENGLGSSGK